MAASDRISIAGEPYEIADPSKIKTGRRTYIETQRPSQPFETTPQVYSWAPWGPIGNSRSRLGGPLATDYAIDLDHRYDYLLTSAAKRNAVDLVTIGGGVQFASPIADVQNTNWSEGAGNADANAWDELVDTPPVSDDATTYWTTSTNDAELILQLAIPASTVTPGSPTYSVAGSVIRVQNSVSPFTIELKIYEGATLRITDSIALTGTTWQGATELWSQAEMDSITDFTNLRWSVERTSGSGDLDVSMGYAQLPDIRANAVKEIDQDRGYVFLNRGNRTTQIDTSDMSSINDVAHGAAGTNVTDSVAEWQASAFVALGDKDVVQERTAVTASGSTYTDVTSVNAYKMVVSSDRLWLADAAGGADDGKVKFAVDALTSAALSNAFQVADPSTDITGLYASGDRILLGFTRGLNSFTASGKPSRFMANLRDFPSLLNAASGDEVFEGWSHIATQRGLFAINVDERIVNPVGPSEGSQGKLFEGPFDGFPTEVAFIGEEVYVAYFDENNFDTYIFVGLFGAQTAATGRPDWYSFRKITGDVCYGIGMTSLRTNPTLITGEGDNFAWYTLGRRQRQIDDANYVFDAGGGQWFGTTLMMPIGVRGNVRWAKLFTENCDASNNWTVAVDVDDASSYIDVGSAIIANGAQTVRPVSAGAPLGTVAFTSLKPRLTQVAASETAPPQIRGELAIGVDARPEFVREVDVLLDLEKQSQLTDLQTLITDDTLSPVTIRFPTDQGVNEDKYGYVVSAEWYDRSDPNDNVALVKLREWDVS